MAVMKVRDFVYFIGNVACDLDSPIIHTNADGMRWGDRHYGYVLGAQGQLYSLALATAWARRHPTERNYFLVDCARWYDFVVSDCSGNIIQALRTVKPTYSDQTANGLYSRCTKKGKIRDIPEVPGIVVWKRGHIGVYVGNGFVIENRGYKYGTVLSPLTSQPWTNWGYLCDVDYDEVLEPFEVESDFPPFHVPGKVLKKGTNNISVLFVEKALKAQGFPIGVPNYLYDAETMMAVRALQMALGFIGGDVDGLWGDKTAKAYKAKYLDAPPVVVPVPAPAPTPAPEPTIDPAPKPEFPAWYTKGKLLRPGQNSKAVTALQNALGAQGFFKHKSTGFYGDITKAAVEAAQKALGFKGKDVDGIFGDKTARAWAKKF